MLFLCFVCIGWAVKCWRPAHGVSHSRHLCWWLGSSLRGGKSTNRCLLRAQVNLQLQYTVRSSLHVVLPLLRLRHSVPEGAEKHHEFLGCVPHQAVSRQSCPMCSAQAQRSTFLPVETRHALDNVQLIHFSTYRWYSAVRLHLISYIQCRNGTYTAFRRTFLVLQYSPCATRTINMYPIIEKNYSGIVLLLEFIGCGRPGIFIIIRDRL